MNEENKALVRTSEPSASEAVVEQAKGSADAAKKQKGVKISKSQANFKEAMLLLDRLTNDFPNAFTPKGTPKKPLKIHIHKDICTHYRQDGQAISPLTLRIAMQFYTSRLPYLKEICTGAHRVDLAGDFAGEVTASAQEHALSASNAIKAKRKAEAPKSKKKVPPSKPGKSDKKNKPIKTKKTSQSSKPASTESLHQLALKWGHTAKSKDK